MLMYVEFVLSDLFAMDVNKLYLNLVSWLFLTSIFSQCFGASKKPRFSRCVTVVHNYYMCGWMQSNIFALNI